MASKRLKEPPLPIENVLEEEGEFERDYSKMDLVDLIDQPAWKMILIDLVKTEKMDPWDIDVAELAEKYLKKINELEHGNLRVPANAILACAILLKTKSKYLRLGPIEEDEDDKQIAERQGMLALEEIPDLMANRAYRDGKISLDELVASIESILESGKTGVRAARQIPRIEIDFDTSTIEERVSEILDKIRQRVDSQGIVMFFDLIEGREPSSLVEMFVPVLFLMNGGKIIAYQDEFFGDIFVQLVPESEWPKK
ncbi:MAG: ScpA family protein [archaeon]|jgi:segregation and condensation protein A